MPALNSPRNGSSRGRPVDMLAPVGTAPPLPRCARGFASSRFNLPEGTVNNSCGARTTHCSIYIDRGELKFGLDGSASQSQRDASKGISSEIPEALPVADQRFEHGPVGQEGSAHVERATQDNRVCKVLNHYGVLHSP